MSARPGFTPWPRHTIVRVNDLVDASVDVVAGVLARRGIATSDRTRPADTTTRAVLAATGAGTLVTLERRTAPGHGRGRLLRALGRDLTAVVGDLDTPPATAGRASRIPAKPDNTPQD